MAGSSADDFAIKGAARRASSATADEECAAKPMASRRSRSPSRDSTSRQEDMRESGSSSRRQRSPSEDGETRDDAPPLPDEPIPETTDVPPLPQEAPPEDDGWEPRVVEQSGAYYYINRFTGAWQWENPRMPDDPYGYKAVAAATAAATAHISSGAPGTEGTSSDTARQPSPPPGPYLGYNPKIHGDYDPNADYAKWHEKQQEEGVEVDTSNAADMINMYDQQATFNRFTGQFQGGNKNAEYHNDENKSKRQMNNFFDVDRAANAHDGRSLKAERAQKKLSKAQVKAFNEQRKAKKEQKRREFLMN